MIRIDKLFLEPPDKSYDKLKIDRESISYITTPHNSLMILWMIRSNIDKDLADTFIFDGTAGVGGDLIAFGHVFGKVVGCEKDISRFEMLKNNIDVYDMCNVEVINEDSIKVLFDLYANDINDIDIVYLDPPWGGRTYKDHDKLTLSMNNIPIETIVNRLMKLQKTKLIVLKLPQNYDLRYMYEKTSHKNSTMMLYRLEKMIIIIFKIIT